MLGAPNRTPYDLTFSVAGIPVRVHPLFWLVAAVLGFRAGDPAAIVIWMVVLFLSILVHELGHAFTMRYYGHKPSVVLYAGGGLAMYQSMDSPWSSFSSFGGHSKRESPWTKIIISAAGPAAGFVLAGIVIAYLVVGGVSASFLGIDVGQGDSISSISPYVGLAVVYLLFINIFWGLVNCLPIYPLDGGQIARELFMMFSYDGVRQSLWLSLVTSAAVAVAGAMLLNSIFIAILFGYFAVINWQMLQGFGGGGGFGGGRPW